MEQDSLFDKPDKACRDALFFLLWMNLAFLAAKSHEIVNFSRARVLIQVAFPVNWPQAARMSLPRLARIMLV